MSDTILSFDQIFDNTLNPFTGVITPVKIGLGDRSAERRTIPATTPYQIKLFHQPIQYSPSVTNVQLVATSVDLEEKSKTDIPADGQYRVNYDENNNGIVDFSSAQAGLQVDISYYAQATIIRKQTFEFQVNSLGATLVFASSDSEATSKAFADSIINVSEDTGAALNAAAVGLTNGGRIVLMEGTFNVKTEITLANNIVLEGAGRSTKLIKAADIASVIDLDTDSRTGIVLKDFDIDGVKGTYTGANYDNILGNTSDYTSGAYNIYSHDADDHGFKSFQRMENCYTIDNDQAGFNGCTRLTGCVARSNGDKGFESCSSLSNCYALQNTDDGFNGCSNLANCDATSNTANGFQSCDKLSTCFSTDNVDGVNSCSMITSCASTWNSSDGFQDCNTMGFNEATNNTGANYNNSFADKAGINACADTAAGGYNG